MGEQIALSLTPRLIAVIRAIQNQGTILTVFLRRSLTIRFVVRFADLIEIDICERRKLLKQFRVRVVRFFTAINRGVNEKGFLLLPSP
jgi:hypothetical protein